MENRVKQYLVATVAIVGDVSSEKVEEAMRQLVYEVVTPREGTVADAWTDPPHCNPRIGSVTIYWQHDPFDQDPDPPHLVETGAWLMNIAPIVKKALDKSGYLNVEISLVTERRTVKPLLIL